MKQQRRQETPEERNRRLATLRERVATSRASGTVEQREARLQDMITTTSSFTYSWISNYFTTEPRPPKPCNGTRLRVKKMLDNVIEATILTGK
jgi:hypothetical protein